MSAFTVEDQERQRDEQNDRWKMLEWYLGMCKGVGSRLGALGF